MEGLRNEQLGPKQKLLKDICRSAPLDTQQNLPQNLRIIQPSKSLSQHVWDVIRFCPSWEPCKNVCIANNKIAYQVHTNVYNYTNRLSVDENLRIQMFRTIFLIEGSRHVPMNSKMVKMLFRLSTIVTLHTKSQPSFKCQIRHQRYGLDRPENVRHQSCVSVSLTLLTDRGTQFESKLFT